MERGLPSGAQRRGRLAQRLLKRPRCADTAEHIVAIITTIDNMVSRSRVLDSQPSRHALESASVSSIDNPEINKQRPDPNGA